MADFYTILTDIGVAKMANAQVSGNKVDLTQIAVGDSNGSYYNPTSNTTTLRNEKWRGNIGAIEIDDNNPNWIVIETTVPATDGGFMVREVGLFDAVGDLIAIGKYPETYKPILAEGSAKDLYVRMIIEVSNAETVTLKIDPTIIIASRKYVDEKVTPLAQTVSDHTMQLAQTVDQLESQFINVFYPPAPLVSVVGDGITDDTTAFNALINYANQQGGGTVFLPDRTYKANVILKDNVNLITYKAVIDGSVTIKGVLGDTVEYTAIDRQSITSANVTEGDMLYIFKTNARRELTEVKRVSGGVAYFNQKVWNIFDTTYTVQKVTPCQNVSLQGIEVIGYLNIEESRNVDLYNIKASGLNISRSLNVKGDTLYLNLGNGENRVDIFRAAKNIRIKNIIITGGNTQSDNSAFKVNEGHDIYVQGIQVDDCFNGFGFFHAIMVDGNYAEEGFGENPSINVVFDDVFSDTSTHYHSIFVTVSERIKISNAKATNLNIKLSDNVKIFKGDFEEVTLEGLSTNINIRDTDIQKLEGNLSNSHFYDCSIKDYYTAGNNHKLLNCKVDNWLNTGNACELNQFVNTELSSTGGEITINNLTYSDFIDCQFKTFTKIIGSNRLKVSGIVNHMNPEVGIWLQNCDFIDMDIRFKSSHTSPFYNGGNVGTSVQKVMYTGLFA